MFSFLLETAGSRIEDPMLILGEIEETAKLCSKVFVPFYNSTSNVRGFPFPLTKHGFVKIFDSVFSLHIYWPSQFPCKEVEMKEYCKTRKFRKDEVNFFFLCMFPQRQ